MNLIRGWVVLDVRVERGGGGSGRTIEYPIKRGGRGGGVFWVSLVSRGKKLLIRETGWGGKRKWTWGYLP